jgi:hypothetical protein
VLIAYADANGPPQQPTMIQNEILAEPGVTAVDLFDALSGTPTLQQLQQYNIVFAFSNNGWNNAVAMGDVLATYQDGGGVVVVGTFAWDNGGSSHLQGRWMTGGYTPYTSTNLIIFSNNTANITQPGHPLMQGVNSLSAFYRIGVALTSGAVSVADWTDGRPAVAYKTNNGTTGVGINAYLGSNPMNFSGEWGRVIVNAGRWLLPCPSPTPTATATATPTPTATATATATPTPCTFAAPNAQNATNVTFSSFTANWSGVNGAAGYRLDVSTTNSFITYVPGYQNLSVGNTTSYNVAGLSAQTTYYYRVRAYNGNCTSRSSNVKSVQTLPCTPATPTAQNATNVTATSFTANWSSVSGATDYRLDVSTSNSFTTYVPGYHDLSVGNTTSYNVTGLTAQTTYYYRVRAYNGCATSANSNVKNVQTPPCTPAAPNAQNATNVANHSFTANWSGVNGATGYRLDVSTSNSFTTYVPGYQDLNVGNTTSYPVFGLNAFTTYYYRVRAYNSCGTSPNSNVKSVTTFLF